MRGPQSTSMGAHSDASMSHSGASARNGPLTQFQIGDIHHFKKISMADYGYDARAAVREGLLWKLSTDKKWQKGWVVITPLTLDIYSDQKRPTQGTIPIRRTELYEGCVAEPHDTYPLEAQLGFSFVVRGPLTETDVVLAADSQDPYMEWLGATQDQCLRANMAAVAALELDVNGRFFDPETDREVPLEEVERMVDAEDTSEESAPASPADGGGVARAAGGGGGGSSTAHGDSEGAEGGDGMDSRGTPVPGSGSEPQVSLLDAYEVGEEIGRGTFGATYKGFHRYSGRAVCIKGIIVPHGRELEDVVHGATEEARRLEQLSHPNIALFYDALQIPGDNFYIVMEFLEGGSLRKAIAEGQGPCVSMEACRRFARQAASALAEMHGSEPAIIHRDLKPDNICLTRRGTAKIVDLGAALDRAGDTFLSSADGNSGMGSLAYMCRDRLEGRSHHTTADDCWALGLMLLEVGLARPYQDLFPGPLPAAMRDQGDVDALIDELREVDGMLGEVAGGLLRDGWRAERALEVLQDRVSLSHSEAADRGVWEDRVQELSRARGMGGLGGSSASRPSDAPADRFATEVMADSAAQLLGNVVREEGVRHEKENEEGPRHH